MRRSYTVRLALAFAGVGVAAAAVTAILVNLAFGGLLTGYLDQQQKARQDRVVALLADTYAQHQSWNSSDLDALAPSLLMEGAEVTVEDPSGRTVWDLSSSHPDMMGGMSHGMMGSTPRGPAQRLTVSVDGRTVGTAVIQLPATGALPTDVAFRDSVTRVLLLGGLVAGLAAMGLGVLLARRATGPVRELTGAAQALAAGNHEQRVEHTSSDEFGAMAAAFNSMADSLGEEDRLRRTFAGDVAHELRTPLMILMSQLEAMEDGVIELGPEAIRSLQDETQRMSKLVADLEVLASADAARFTLKKQPLDLADQASAAASEFARLFEQKSVRLETRLNPVQVNGDPGRLRQVIGNLLSNALKFTPEGGWVRISVEQEHGLAVLEVADSGAGIPPGELDKVFDRFFRGQGARAGGSGIGLTVVRDLVTAHGGEVAASNRPDGGALFKVTLPAISPGGRRVNGAQVAALRP